MFSKYVEYDKIIERMIQGREDNEAALISLKEQYAEATDDNGVGAVKFDQESVQTSPIDDGIINLAIRREMLECQIKELEEECRLLDRAWNLLESEERQVLETFYQHGLRRQDAIDVLCDQLYCERATIYRKRIAALHRLKKLLFG